MAKIVDLQEEDSLSELIFGKKAIVMFWRLNSGCVGMDNNLKAITPELPNNTAVIRVEISRDENAGSAGKRAADDHGISSVPTVIFFDIAEKARIEGLISYDDFLETAKNAFGSG